MIFSRSIGASDLRILVRHLLPNAAGTVVAAGTSLIGQIALLEATVEFIGFGVSSQVRPTLGSYNTLGLDWWMWACPAIVLVLILVCANLAGDGIDAALNPRAAARG